MPIQQFRARDKQPSTASKFAETFGNAIGDVGEAYFNRQKEKAEKAKKEQAFQFAQQIISNENLSDAEKQGQLFSTLRDYPDEAKAIASQLSGMSKVKTDAKKKENEAEEKERKEHENKKNLLRETGEYKTEEDLDRAAKNYDLQAVRTKWDRATKPKPAEKPPKAPPKSELTKTLEKETAKGYIEAQREIPKIEDSLRNLDRMAELGSGPLKGPTGYLPAIFGTESAREYDSLAASTLEPIIKIFNPVGAVPTEKLNWIRKTFAPSAGELRSTQEGKENALRRLAEQAKSRAQQKIKLFDDYKGDPPASEVFKFDAESSQYLNSFIDQNQYVDVLKKETPDGKILMLDPQGKTLHADPEDVEEFIRLGAKKIE